MGFGDGDRADVIEVKPRNFREDVFRWGNSTQQIAETITLGREPSMPSFEDVLSEQEIREVAGLVRSLSLDE